MGKYDALFDTAPAKPDVGEYSALFDELAPAGKYSALFDEPQEAQLTSFLENPPTPSTPSDQTKAWWKEFYKLPSEQQEAWWKKEVAAVDLKDKLEHAPWYEALAHDIAMNKYVLGTLMGVAEGVYEIPKIANLFGADYENLMTAEIEDTTKVGGKTFKERLSPGARTISRIGTQLVPAGAAVQAASKLPKVAQLAAKAPKTATAAKVALTDFLALAGDEPGLADMAAESGFDSPLLVTKKREGESEFTGRMKNATEALLALGGTTLAAKAASPVVRKIAQGTEWTLSKEDKFIRPVVSKMEEISPRLANRMHKFELDGNLLRQEYVDRMQPFAEHYKLMVPATQETLQRLTSNERTMPAAFEMLTKLQKRDPRFAGVKDAFKETRTALDELHELATRNGIEVGYLKGYVPRQMDYDKYMKSLGKKPPDDLEKMFTDALKKKEDELYQHVKLDTATGAVDSSTLLKAGKIELDAAERAQVIKEYFEGRRPAGATKSRFQKHRTLDSITKETQPFYDDMLDSLQGYVNNITYKVNRNRFTGKAPGSMDQSIFAEIERHGGNRAKEATDLIATRLAGGERRVGKGINAARNFIYATTIGNPYSTITQLGDAGMNAYRNGLINTVKPFGPKVKLKDFGLNDIAAEFTDAGAMKGAMDKLFKGTGFKQLDVALKESNVRGAFRQAQKQLANKNSKTYKKFIEENRPFFEGETDALAKSIRDGNIRDENVKLYLFSRLSKTQPISLSEMPAAYLNSKSGRLAYALKTFTIKQLELVRSDILRKLSKKETMGEGMKNAARLSVLFGGTTGAINVTKDIMLGRPVEIDDAYMDAMTTNIGISKYAIYKGKDDGLVGFGAALLAPPMPVVNEAFKVLVADDREKAVEKQSKELLRYIPMVGKDVYWRLGPGPEKIRKRRLDKLKGRD